VRNGIQLHARRALGALAIVVVVALAASSSAAADGTAYVLSDVQCDANHNGVLDLTLVNEQASQSAHFVVTAAESSKSSSISVAASSASAITFTELPDGLVVVPVSIDGADAGVAVRVACDAPEVAVLGVPSRSLFTGPSLPQTGSSTGGLLTGGILVAAGIAASLVSRRRYS
jgi:LPXTG-motif cell wall-anchored protein